MKTRILTLLFVTGLMAGCSTVRQARVAQKESGQGLPMGERTATPEEFGVREGELLSLAFAQDFSLQWHPAMATATQKVIAARINISKAGAGRRPSLSGSVGYGGGRNGNSAQDWNFTTTDDFNASLSLTWVLYDFGRTRASIRSAVADLIAAHETLSETRVQRIQVVRSAYFKLAQAQAQCRVDEENLKQYDQLLRQAELRFKIGTGRKYDVTKAKADRSNALLSLLTTTNTIITARAELNNQMGLGKVGSYALEADVRLPEPGVDFDVLFAVAQTNQPTLRALRANVDAAVASVDRTVAELYPQIRATAATAYSTGAIQTLGFSWGLALLQDLFKSFEKRDNILVSVTALRQARASLALQEQNVVKTLIAALSSLNTARQGKGVAEEMELQAKENLDLVMKQFEVGASSILEVTDAQVLYTRARSAAVSARYTLENAKAGVYAIIGME
jgi:outer membrane protein